MPDRQLSNGSLDAVFVDFYGTIAAGDRAAVENTCEGIVRRFSLPMPASRLAVTWGDVFFRIIEESNHESFQTLLRCEIESLGETLRSLGVDADSKTLGRLVEPLEAYWSKPDVYPDALEFLEEIDLPVCCVSNADTAHLRAALDHHQIRFDAVVTSEDAKCYKPDSAIFERALDQLGVTADRVMHVGDSLHSDVCGAAGRGILTVWVRREDRIHDVGNHEPDHCASTMTEVIPLLR